jgi:hypothetical protein
MGFYAVDFNRSVIFDEAPSIDSFEMTGCGPKWADRNTRVSDGGAPCADEALSTLKLDQYLIEAVVMKGKPGALCVGKRGQSRASRKTEGALKGSEKGFCCRYLASEPSEVDREPQAKKRVGGGSLNWSLPPRSDEAFDVRAGWISGAAMGDFEGASMLSTQRLDIRKQS